MLGGLPDLLQYYMYYVIYEQPPMSDKRPIILTNVSTQIFVKMKRGEFRLLWISCGLLCNFLTQTSSWKQRTEAELEEAPVGGKRTSASDSDISGIKRIENLFLFPKSIPAQLWMAVWSRSVRSTTNIVSIDNNIGLWTRPFSITFDFCKIINTTVTEHLSLIPLSKLSWKWSCTKVNLCPKPDIFHFWNYLKLFCDDHTWLR